MARRRLAAALDGVEGRSAVTRRRRRTRRAVELGEAEERRGERRGLR